MEDTNQFYRDMVMDLSNEQFEQFFIQDIRNFIEEKMHAAMGKLISADPLSEEEFLKILAKGLGDGQFKRQLILTRIHDFSASCKIKNASNKWVVDYFYLSCLKQLLLGKRVERVKKTGALESYLNETKSMINTWISSMEIPVEKKFFGRFGKSDEEKVEIAEIDAAQLYPSLIDITEHVFVIFHSLAAGLEKERNDVTYEYELVDGEIDFSEIEEMERKDAVKAARIQKDQTAVNLFENLIALYFLHLGQP